MKNRKCAKGKEKNESEKNIENGENGEVKKENIFETEREK